MFFWKHYFYRVFSKAQLFKSKNGMLKNRKFMKNSGLSLNMAKWCFLGLYFWGFNVIVVCFWCVWHSSRSVKNACFSQFWGLLWGGLFLFILGLEGLGVFVFLVFVFVFFVLRLFLFCLLCFYFVVGLFLVLVLVLLLFLFVLFFLFLFFF